MHPGDEPGNLPLLKFVLKELWRNRRGQRLLNQTYDDIGKLQGAIAKKADKFFTNLSPADQKILRRARSLDCKLEHPARLGE